MYTIYKRGNTIDLCVLDESMIEFFYTSINDEEVTKFLSVHRPMSKSIEENWIIEANDSNNIALAIVTKDSVLIGSIGLHHINQRNQFCELGIAIGNKRYWGRGMGTEAILLLLHIAFKKLNMRRVQLSVYGFNKRARKAYKKCGFTEEGCYPNHLFMNGKWRDEIRMAITAKQWKKGYKKH